MSVAVYPRLSELLRQRNLTVAELSRQIARRFGLTVDPKTLYRLTDAAPIQRADLAIAGAVASILDVGLDDLFEVQAVPVAAVPIASEINALDPWQSHRLSELFDRQAHGILSPTEAVELEALVATYGRQLHEQRLRELAAQRGISLEEARRAADEGFDRAREWWQTFEASPERRQAVVARVTKQERRSIR